MYARLFHEGAKSKSQATEDAKLFLTQSLRLHYPFAPDRTLTRAVADELRSEDVFDRLYSSDRPTRAVINEMMENVKRDMELQGRSTRRSTSSLR